MANMIGRRIILSALLIASTASAQEFTIDRTKLAPEFVGFGAQFNGWLYSKPNWGLVTEENVKDLEAKVVDLAPQHVRIFCEINDKSPQKTDSQVHESVMRVVELA